MSREYINNSQIFSDRLKSLRGSRSKAGFAKELGIGSPVTYFNYEKGRVPKSVILEQIASKCNVTVDWLLGRDAPTVVSAMAPTDQTAFTKVSEDEGAKQAAQFQRQIDFRFEQIRKLPLAYRQKLRDEIIFWLDKYMEWSAANYPNEQAATAARATTNAQSMPTAIKES